LYTYGSEINYPALGYNVPKSTGKQVFYCCDFGSKQTKMLMKIQTRLWIVNIDEQNPPKYKLETFVYRLRIAKNKSSISGENP
jgi:hypothetical protein